MYPRSAKGSWLDELSDEDLAFLKRFVLASGSLKDLAVAYGVTYPTIRIRLDRLIEKIQILDEIKTTSSFERAVLAMYADGKVDVNTMKALFVAHELEMQSVQQAAIAPAKTKPG
jgi:hypothetical protein